MAMAAVGLSEILYGVDESKKVWYGAKNYPNPEYERWALDWDAGGPPPAARSSVDVKRGAFNIDEFRKLSDQKARLSYLRAGGMWIGHGSSRVVFAISPKMVIKLAGGNALDSGLTSGRAKRMEEAGRAQNRHEYRLWERLGGDDVGRLLPQCFELSPDGGWLLAELVRPLYSDDELMQLSDLSPEDYERFMEIIDGDGFFRSAFADGVIHDMEERQAPGLEFVLLIKRLQRLAPGLALIELSGINQWGKGSDGRLVLLDPGADEDIIGRFYS